MAAAPVIGWYGKLPSRGDFVGRGLPRPLLRDWDGWLQRAMAAAGQRVGAALLDERLLAMAPWQCLVLMPEAEPEAEPAVWHGVVTASADRVGRVFPLLVAEVCEAARLDGLALEALRARAVQIAGWLVDGAREASVREFEAGAASWSAVDWPGVDSDGSDVHGDTLRALRDRHPSARSFWWRLGPEDGLADVQAQPWPPREELLLEWLAVTD